MIKLIYGAKGSGKTGKIIADANDYVNDCNGEVVFLTDTDKYMHKVNYNIRLVNVTDYDIVTDLGLTGFIRGIIAGNRDIERVYVDGIHRMTHKELDQLQEAFEALEKYSDKLNVDMVFTASTDVLPDYMLKYQKEKA